MKKRILSILLCLCMAACMLPTVAFAADTGKAIQLGTNALNENVNTAAAPTVYFGQDHGNNPGAWRVIGYDGNDVTSAQGDMTLLAADTMGVTAFNSVAYSDEYAPSELKTAIDTLAAKLTTEENAAVKKRTLTSGSYDGENTDCVAGDQVDNAVFWPLSIAEALAVNQDLRTVDKKIQIGRCTIGGCAPQANHLLVLPLWMVAVKSSTMACTIFPRSMVFVPLLT